MSQHLYLVQESVASDSGLAEGPSPRWQQAFPAGRAVTWPRLPADLAAGDTLWLPVSTPEWETRVAQAVARHPQCPVVVVSLAPDDVQGLRAINAGARGYCHQLAVPQVLQEVAQVVAHGGLWVGPDLVQRLLSATRSLLQRSPSAPVPPVDLSVLSDRERQVAQAVADGCSNREAAERLFISERTVKAHLGVIFEKLHVRDRVQLVLLLSDRPVA